MTPEQTAKQLRLAADILETGHPWETSYTGLTWHETSKNNNPAIHILNGQKIRPVLATPPDGRPLHNPDNLTAEQVGVGYRLPVDGDIPNSDHWVWVRDLEEWEYLLPQSWGSFDHRYIYRLPLSVPWPPAPVDPYADLKAAHAAWKVIQFRRSEDDWRDLKTTDWRLPVEEYRIKPDAPPFVLPPPPGMSWHRKDWTVEMLPSGTRPLADGELFIAGDEWLECGKWMTHRIDDISSVECNHRRTTRPMTFEHAGKTWTWHRPGDPMPCDGERIVAWLMHGEDGEYLTGPSVSDSRKGIAPTSLNWEEDTSIIGWRYAEPATKEVELGPEDVPPGSVFRHKDWLPGIHRTYQEVNTTGVQWCNHYMDWLDLKDNRWQINRSIPLTGKWNPDDWKPCSKTVPA